jgi:hypothetical protein
MSIEIKSIVTASEFAMQIEQIVSNSELGYMDAIVSWCEQNKIEIEQAVTYVRKNQVIKAKLEMEAEQLNLIEKTSAKLPI